MNNFQHYLAEEFAEDYSEGRITRREALRLIASVTGSLLLAQTFLAACAPPPTSGATDIPTSTTSPTSVASPTATVQPTTASAATGIPTTNAPTANPPAAGTVMPDDPAVIAAPLEFAGDDATLLGYLSRPSLDGAFPVVLVCHENRGLTDHIRDMTRRFAKAGYVALAVDLVSRQGGTDAVGSGGVPGALGNIDPDQFVRDFRSGWEYLKTQSFAQAERVGMTGYCFGGGVTWRVATQMPELKAAVPYYGPHPDVADVPNIVAPVLAMYGELDSRINGGIPAIEAAMQANGKVYEKVIYPQADHAFNNDTGTRYNAEAAKDAWARTLAWFAKYL